ncbi:hypothetical protein B5F77_15090 [Parabacteroides sp. An277]|nr:hypothetical protein B5F77_15090 [Parabacteroides sp. An277]
MTFKNVGNAIASAQWASNRVGNGIASTQWASNHVENGIASTQWASNRVGNGIASTQWASNHVGNGIASTQWASNHVRSVFAIRNGISHVFQAVISLGEHTLQHEKAPIPPKNGPRKRSNPQVAVGRSHRRGLRRIVDIHFVAYKLLQASLRSDPQLQEIRPRWGRDRGDIGYRR